MKWAIIVGDKFPPVTGLTINQVSSRDQADEIARTVRALLSPDLAKVWVEPCG